MKDLLTILKDLQNTPLPLILVGGGILFLFIAVGGQIGAKISPDSKVKEKAAGIIGVILLLSGICLYIVPSVLPVSSSPTRSNTEQIIDSLEGVWSGTAQNSDWKGRLTVTIAASCGIGAVCGTFNLPDIPCSGTLAVLRTHNNMVEFTIPSNSGACGKAESLTLELLPDATLSYISVGDFGETRAILHPEN